MHFKIFYILTDGSITGWGAILIAKPNKYSEKDTEKIVRYNSGNYKEKINSSSIDLELLAIIYAIDSFELFIISKKEITIRTDCEAIVSFVSKFLSYFPLTISVLLPQLVSKLIIYAIDSFELFIIIKKEITIRTDCEAIVSFVSKF